MEGSGSERGVRTERCVITCALSGVAANRDQCPGIPYTPEDYAAEARRAYESGASVVHIHARYPDGTPSYEVREYRDITQAILTETPDVIINFSTGAVGIPIEERVRHITALKPELGALNMGSMNYAKYSSRRKRVVFDFVFANPFADITFLLEQLNSVNVKPECECFDTGHIGNVEPLIDMGLLLGTIQFSLITGVLGGAPANPRTLAHMTELLPPDNTWEVIAIGRAQWRMVAGGGRTRRQRPRGSGGQLLSSRRRDGEIKRRSRRARGADRAALGANGGKPFGSARPAASARGSRSQCTRRVERGESVSEEVMAEMVANVWKVVVGEGDNVGEGDTICILESMKMEIPVEATAAGTISELKVTEGGVVQEGDVIAVID